MNEKLKITLVELEATIDGRLDGKPARDIYSLLRMPARSLPTLEAVVRAARPLLRVWGDISSAGLTMTVPNGMDPRALDRRRR